MARFPSIRRALAVIALGLGLPAAAQPALAQSTTLLDSLIDHSLRMFDMPPAAWDIAANPLRPRIGLYSIEVPADSLRAMATLPEGSRGFRVWHLMPNWSADAGGLLIGDIVVGLNGKPIGDSLYQGDEFISLAVREMRPGDTARFSVIRGGAVREVALPVTPARRTPMAFAEPSRLGPVQTESWLQGELRRQNLLDWWRNAHEQMLIIADQDFCTVPFTERPSPWRLNAVTYLHHYPMRTGAYSRHIVRDLWEGADAGLGLAGVVRAAARHLDVERPDDPMIGRPWELKELNGVFAQAQAYLDTAYAPVRGKLGAMTAELLPLLSMENNWEEGLDTIRDPLSRRGARIGEERKLAALFGDADRVDMHALARAAETLAMLADTAWLRDLTTQIPKSPKRTKPVAGVEGTVAYVWETKLGRCVVGGAGSNRYTGDFRFILDLGGDDVYDLPDVPVGTFRCVADVAGNDLYQSRLSGQGAGIGAVDLLVDVSGDDTYRATRYAQGAGLLGAGMLADFAGDDVYTARWCAQGAATLGIGILYDGAGSDSYNAEVYSQAFAYMRGFGALLENGGNDSYRAGWKYPDSRGPGRAHLAMSQGFGFGMRPWSTGVGTDGGIGVLTDRTGHDLYASDFFSQGGSYWYALGVLHDGEGADRYTAGQYSQGSGIHLSFGALLDDAGDDMYDAYAGLEQGNAHDWSAGCLEDWRGNDTYRGSSSSQGSALTVAFAWLLDSQGNDQYYALLSDTTHSQGGGSFNRVRNGGSLGLLVDLGAGNDYYVEPRIAPGVPLVKGNKGIVYDDGAPKR